MANEIVVFGEGRIWKWRLCGDVVAQTGGGLGKREDGKNCEDGDGSL